MAANIIVTEPNTLPVLYNINSSTVILLYHQQYICIAIYIYICCMMKPYIKDGKCAISSPMHTSVCKSPPVDITNMK